MTEYPGLEQMLRSTYQESPRHDVWHAVTRAAARYFTTYYAPIVEAYDELTKEGQDDDTDTRTDD